jgi:HSP20 family protein
MTSSKPTGQLTSSERNLARRQYFDPTWGFGGDLFRMSPFALLRMMTEQMDRAFSAPGGVESSGGMETWRPAIEVREKDGNLIVSADLPGIDEKDVKIEMTDDVLTIQGERRLDREEERGRFHTSEHRYGSFYRAVQLPEGVQADQVKAEFHNGELKITMPVTESKVNRRQIQIQTTKQEATAARR